MDRQSNQFKRSVAMTTWNAERYLAEQLDSLRTQTIPFDEVVIVDDASSDNTCALLHTYIADHGLTNWHVYEHKENEGFIRSFRDALSKTTGDLIFLCDHDDVWYPEKAETMENEFYVHPELLTLASSFDLIDAKGGAMEDKRMMRRANHNLIRRSVNAGAFTWMTFEDIAGYNISPGCTLALRSLVKEQYLSTPADMNLPHDWAVCAIAAIQNGLGYLDVPLMGYRQHEHNTLGLSRRSAYTARLKAARQDYAQKEALLALTHQFNASSEVKWKMKEIAQFFAQRAQALADRSIFQLGALMASSAGSRFRLTIGMDIKSVIASSGSDAQSEE